MKGNNLGEILKDFLLNIETIKETLPMTFLLLNPHRIESFEKITKFINKKINYEEIDGKKVPFVKEGEVRIFEQLKKDADISGLSFDIISESLFVSLISKYDAFLNNLLISLYNIKPEIINSSDKKISFSDFYSMENIDLAKKYIIEKEVEGVLRDSHEEHFKYLETKLGMKLRENLDIWGKFIELTERRNLIVHNNGIINNQYFSVCCENNNPGNINKVGDKIKIDISYFNECYYVLYELTVKLTITIWRKLIPGKLEEIDKELNNICFDLLNLKEYKLADKLLDFACSQKKFSNNENKYIYIINKSLSKYLQGDKEAANSIIGCTDWSAFGDDFKLAVSIIKENYNESYNLMKKIGLNGDIDKNAYIEWPLFNDIKKEKEFRKTYEEIFGESYKNVKLPEKMLKKIINKSKNSNIKKSK
ncbi:MAG: hypothetical protein PHH98_02880 [Candidatus Gracilibacteria bacterium]|nr:hypothetical protein [Candidatus Gracilibacteria bacterium]